MIPLPSLPVLSAMSCSTQSPKLLIDGEVTRVSFSEAPSGQRTIVEVETADEPGVLRRITAAFAGEGVDIQLARVLTEARRVFDVFYVSRLDDQERARLESTVRHFLRRT